MALSMYAGAGLFAGLMMQRAIPPLNPLGVTFIALTWPNQIRCARVSSGCDPTPYGWMEPYLFTFPEEPRHAL
ncbi:hypothetical protein U0C82_03960 [Fulvimarina sp. 2208YS6-2-32]|uniref:Uncharacterized protein n=1 Tax=Fulvimarina uroteuthidis TaxID=3098149 RepID=A0ABU5HZ32_9HYPH|nr:hypothetical protein [Fulvimarina sp. 2208YS6-2-32]MDY8108305.1 hypothetical protein [Fulvimarina sp. 2208YS6-2-32]